MDEKAKRGGGGEGGGRCGTTQMDGYGAEECLLFMEKVAVTIKAEKGDKQPDITPSAHGFGKIR